MPPPPFDPVTALLIGIIGGIASAGVYIGTKWAESEDAPKSQRLPSFLPSPPPPPPFLRNRKF